MYPVLSFQKYLHESRHKHALKRSRGYSGRFSGKDSPQKSSAISLALPTSSETPPLTNEIISGGDSDLCVSGPGQYSKSVVESLKEVMFRGVHLVPEIGEDDADAAMSVETRSISLPLNQLGAIPLRQLASSNNSTTFPVVSSQEQQQIQRSTNTPIRALVNTVQGLSAPVLPTQLHTPTTPVSHPVADSPDESYGRFYRCMLARGPAEDGSSPPRTLATSLGLTELPTAGPSDVSTSSSSVGKTRESHTQTALLDSGLDAATASCEYASHSGESKTLLINATTSTASH